MTLFMDQVRQVRALHAPAGEPWLECNGCDIGLGDSYLPDWPCRTADLVYTPEEIAAAMEAAKARTLAWRSSGSAT